MSGGTRSHSPGASSVPALVRNTTPLRSPQCCCRCRQSLDIARGFSCADRLLRRYRPRRCLAVVATDAAAHAACEWRVAIRTNLNAVLLPTSEVVVCGGFRDTTQDPAAAVLEIEIYHPLSNSWTTLPADANPTVATQLPFGRAADTRWPRLDCRIECGCQFELPQRRGLSSLIARDCPAGHRRQS